MSDSLGERRLTAIVAVDLAGFSRRAEANEDSALADVAALAARVAQVAQAHGGRVFNTAGDGFMLEFQTVSGALEAADALAAAGDVRVGVHLGEVSVGAGGDLLGHGVNIAARLQALAEPGSVVVSGDAQRAVRGGIAGRLVPQGRVRLDKMKETAPVFVLAPADGGKASRIRRRPGRWLAVGLVVAVVAVAVGAGLWWSRTHGAASGATRIAVLPLEALSDRPDGKTFAAGVADQIATKLSANNIAVVSSEDAAALRGPDRERGAEAVGAALVLDGVVQDFGDSMEVRVHLDDPAQHAVLWNADVTGPRAQAAQIQAHVAKLVVNTLGCSSRALAPVHGLRDPALLTRYLHACDIFVNADFTPQNIYELFAALREVTAKAPDFAPAHSDLAKFSGYLMSRLPPSEWPALRAQGLAEAKVALAMDPKSPDARLAQQFLLPITDWSGREALLRQAVSDAPDWPHTNGFLGQLLLDVGRQKEGMSFLQRASAADLNIDWKPITAYLMVCTGQNPGALADVRQEFAEEGDNSTARSGLMSALDCTSGWKEERDLLRSAYAKGVANIGSKARFESRDAFLTAMITGAPKDRETARRLLMQTSGGGYAAVTYGAVDLAILGYVDDAYAFAQQYQGGEVTSMASSKVFFFPYGAPLRRDPRFIALAARLKLVDYWRRTGVWPDFCAEPGLPYDCKAEAAKLK